MLCDHISIDSVTKSSRKISLSIICSGYTSVHHLQYAFFSLAALETFCLFLSGCTKMPNTKTVQSNILHYLHTLHSFDPFVKYFVTLFLVKKSYRKNCSLGCVSVLHWLVWRQHRNGKDASFENCTQEWLMVVNSNLSLDHWFFVRFNIDS